MSTLISWVSGLSCNLSTSLSLLTDLSTADSKYPARPFEFDKTRLEHERKKLKNATNILFLLTIGMRCRAPQWGDGPKKRCALFDSTFHKHTTHSLLIIICVISRAGREKVDVHSRKYATHSGPQWRPVSQCSTTIFLKKKKYFWNFKSWKMKNISWIKK